MNQNEFRKITGEVAIQMLVQPAFTAFTCLTVQRAKNAEKKLLLENYTVARNRLQPNMVKVINESK